MKGFRRAAGRRWHLLERGDTAVLPRGRAGTPVPPRHQRQAPGRHVGLRTPQEGPDSVFLSLLPSALGDSLRVPTGDRSEGAELRSQPAHAALPPYSLPRSWRGDGGRMAAAGGRGSAAEGGAMAREGRLQAVCSGTRGQGRPLESGWHKSHARSPGTTTLNLNWLPFKYHLRAGFPASLSS